MANGRTHDVVGGLAGGAAGLYFAQDEDRINALVEIIGSALGGVAGARLPDIIEPAIHSWHRSIAHSCAVGAGAGAILVNAVAAWQADCREQAACHDELAATAVDPVGRAWHSLCALVWRLISGLIVGLLAGYVSHLVLDATTPRGIPLVI